MGEGQQPAAPSSRPGVVQQTTVIQVGSQKSVGGAVALALLFGPLGMLYATVPGAIVMFFVNIVVALGTVGIGLLLTIPLGAIWAGSAASSHNKNLGVRTQAAAQTAQAAADWYRDPDGSNRLRYWNGQHWTEHYSDERGDLENDEPSQPKAISSENTIACDSCSETIAAGNKFCPACGTARPATA